MLVLHPHLLRIVPEGQADLPDGMNDYFEAAQERAAALEENGLPIHSENNNSNVMFYILHFLVVSDERIPVELVEMAGLDPLVNQPQHEDGTVAAAPPAPIVLEAPEAQLPAAEQADVGGLEGGAVAETRKVITNPIPNLVIPDCIFFYCSSSFGASIRRSRRRNLPCFLAVGAKLPQSMWLKTKR